MTLESANRTGDILMPAAGSIEAALMILGLISHGGANTHMRLSPRNTQRGSALALIAGAMGYLDFLKQKQGLPLYSFPKEVEVRCDNSKLYYFWLSASLVSDLVKADSASAE